MLKLKIDDSGDASTTDVEALFRQIKIKGTEERAVIAPPSEVKCY